MSAELQIRIVMHQTVMWAMGQTIRERHFILSSLIDAMAEINDPVLQIYANVLPVGGVNKVIKAVFKDNIINWGRIV